jgi:Kef-type K+ transport system membrane component KefB
MRPSGKVLAASLLLCLAATVPAAALASPSAPATAEVSASAATMTSERPAQEESGSSLISSIGISIIAATALGYLAQRLRQPLILAYILAGVLVGPEIGLRLIPSRADVEVISEIGLILLLFMIGLEIDVKKLKESGKALILTGFSQFLLCAGLGALVVPLIVPGLHGYEPYYLAACLALSSTAIVVKLLFSKSEIDTVAGRITLGVLVFQDVWAIVLLAIQPNLANPDALSLLLSFAKGAALVGASLLLSRFVLPQLFKSIARTPELLLVASLGWCFLVAAGASLLGLSVEMGALIAGVAISTFPYNLDVIAKVVSIRDFFVTLFFVSLGMMVPNPMGDPSVLPAAALCALFLFLSRFLTVSPILYALRQGHRISLVSALNLANESEFSLVIATLGLAAGHIGQRALSIVIFTFVITSVVSPYAIQGNAKIAEALSRLFYRLGFRPQALAHREDEGDEDPRDIVFLGFHRVASSFVCEVERDEEDAGIKAEDSILRRVMVIDFNPNIQERLRSIGVKVVYGDLSHMDSLQHAGLEGAKLVISTVSDTMLSGTDNLKLVRQAKLLAPGATIVASAESVSRARKMYAEGADLVLLPRMESAKRLERSLDALLEGRPGELAVREQALLEDREDIVR